MPRRLHIAVAGLALATALVAGPLRAEPPPPPTAAQVADKPRPDRARNVVRHDRSWTRHLLWVPRGILFVPKWALWLGAAPIRGTLWTYDRYSVGPRIAQLLSGDGPVSLFPTAKLESGLGVTYGVGVALTDALGAGERVRVKALFGGEARQIYGAKLTTGTLLGRVLESDLDVELQLLENSRYFGIGNDDDGTAVTSRFDQRILRTELGADVQLPGHLVVRASAAYVARSFAGPSSDRDPSPVDVYPADQLVGFDTGTSALYGELEAAYDTRTQSSLYVSAAEPSSGWKAAAFAGYAYGVGDDPSRTMRYGIDVQRYIDVYRGDRILVLRGELEGVTASASDLPFTDLPTLGGSRILRAYARGRFRDRTVSLASAEYRYPLHRFAQAFAFVEAGSALPSPRNLSVAGLHPSYGGGIQLHSPVRFLLRTQVAYGDDGVNFALSFTPSFEVRPRTRRR